MCAGRGFVRTVPVSIPFNQSDCNHCQSCVLKVAQFDDFRTLHYFEINNSDITYYADPDHITSTLIQIIIWINVDVNWLLLEQTELKEPKILLVSLPKVLQLVCCGGVLGNNLPLVVVLISVCTKIQVGYVGSNLSNGFWLQFSYILILSYHATLNE